MKLEEHEAERFYRVWWSLLTYVNQAKGVVKRLPEKVTVGKLPSEEAFKVRNVLWSDLALLDAFVASNPAGLDASDLALVDSWRFHVTGSFFVVRHLKKYSVFVSTENQTAYGVVGLLSEPNEVVPAPPVYVGATLLPFEGRIIYDGLLTSPPIYFGPNIRASLENDYRNAQESRGTVTELPWGEQAEDAMLAGNARLLKAFRAYLAGAQLGETAVVRHIEALQEFARFLIQDEPSLPLLEASLTHARAYLAQHPSAAASFKRYVRFLQDTGRGDFERTDELQELRRRAS